MASTMEGSTALTANFDNRESIRVVSPATSPRDDRATSRPTGSLDGPSAGNLAKNLGQRRRLTRRNRGGQKPLQHNVEHIGGSARLN